MTQTTTIYRAVMLAVLLSVQFLVYTPQVYAQGGTNTPPANTPANNSQQSSNPQATYVGKGAEASIRALLCAPSDASNATTTGGGYSFNGVNATVQNNPAGEDLANCINRGYRFAIAFGAVAAVFFVVLAGYMYMVGGEKGKHEAKSILVSVLAGFLIILSSFVLLRQINPTLVEFRTIQPPQIAGEYSLLPSCSDVGLGVGEDCTFADGTPGVSNGDGTAIPPQGGTMTGKSGKVCSMGKDESPSTKAKCNIEPRLETAFQQAARDTGIDANFLKTIATIESNWKEDAVSWTGCCKGLMQMMDATANRFGCTGSAWKTQGEVIIPCAARYMKYLRDKYNADSYVKIAAGYNAGEGRLAPSKICPGMIVALCPFKDAAQSACIVGKNSLEQSRNYVVKMARIYKEYQQCR